ncbi:MAG: glycosyltransferase [Lentilitoribacter sp.]
MKKTFLLIAKSNSYGLVRDAELIADQLEKSGHSVKQATPKDRSFISRLTRKKHADVIIFFERCFPAWFSAADELYLIPNQERYPKRQQSRLKKLTAALTKTKHADEIFKAIGCPTIEIGFSSEDRQAKQFKKDKSKFFHLAGGSTLKGTETILELWNKHPEWPTLTLVQKEKNAPTIIPENVDLHSGYVSDKDLLKLQNECGVHLCPSRSEGWGHHIIEALSTGAVVLTTDAPPMNEHVSSDIGVLVAYNRQSPRHLGTNFYADSAALEAAISNTLKMDDAAFLDKSKKARAAFETIHQSFIAKFANFITSHGQKN